MNSNSIDPNLSSITNFMDEENNGQPLAAEPVQKILSENDAIRHFGKMRQVTPTSLRPRSSVNRTRSLKRSDFSFASRD